MEANANLGFRADAEPDREHRIEDDQRHRIEARDHRHDQDARPRQAADDGAEQDAAAAGERHRDRDLVERHGKGMAVFAGLVPAGGERRGQRRQKQLGNEACARQDLPQRNQADHDQSAKRCCGHVCLTPICGYAARCGRAGCRMRRRSASHRCAGGAARPADDRRCGRAAATSRSPRRRDRPPRSGCG